MGGERVRVKDKVDETIVAVCNRIQEKIKEDSSNATEQGGIRILLVFLLTFFVNGICSDTDSFFKENLSLTLAHTVTG